MTEESTFDFGSYEFGIGFELKLPACHFAGDLAKSMAANVLSAWVQNAQRKKKKEEEEGGKISKRKRAIVFNWEVYS